MMWNPSALVRVNSVELDRCISVDWQPIRIGELSRSASNRLMDSTDLSAEKVDSRFTAGPYDPFEAQAYRYWIEGRGHTIPLVEDLYTSRGLGPEGNPDADFSDPDGSPYGGPYGTLYETVGWAVLDEDLFSEWTAMLWRYEVSPEFGWAHYIVRGFGTFVNTVWRNGEPQPSASVVAGRFIRRSASDLRVIELGDFASQWLTSFADMVVWPYAIRPEWVPAIIGAHELYSWSPLPYVAVTGEAFPRELLCLGRVVGRRGVPMWHAGINRTGEEFDLILHEDGPAPPRE